MKTRLNIILLILIVLGLGGLFVLNFSSKNRSSKPTTQIEAQSKYDNLPKATESGSMEGMDMDDMEGMEGMDHSNQQLKTGVKFTDSEMIVVNGENKELLDCRFEMNQTIVQKGYTYSIDSIPAKKTISINLSDFSRDGVAFNTYAKKANNVMIMCENGWSYSSNK